MTVEKPIKVVHLTSAHFRGDTRIFVKQCRSLVKAGYAVTMLVADGFGNDKQSGINIIDVGLPESRLNRMLEAPRRFAEEIDRSSFDVLHLHDPELIPLGLRLKRKGTKVIYDAHEDLPSQILSKHYLGRFSRIVLARIFRWYQSFACKRFDAIVAATPYIRDQFRQINENTVDVNNFLFSRNSTLTFETRTSEMQFVILV